MELIISGYINCMFPLWSTTGEIVAMYVSYYSFVICLFVLPSISIWVMINDLNTIRSPEFKYNWSGFYESISLKSKW